MKGPLSAHVLVAVLIVAIPGLVACTSPATPTQTEKVSVRTGLTVYGLHAPLFLAREKGFYAEEGLDVAIQPGKGSVATAQGIGAKTDHFGVIDLSIVPKAISEGVPIKAVGAILQKNPTMVIFRKAEVSKPKDFEGKRIALAPGSSVALLVPAFLTAQGVDMAKVTVVGLGSTEANQAFLARRVDATVVFYNDTYPSLLAQSDAELGSFFLADHGFNFMGTGFVANVEFLKERPDLARRFLKAAYRGYQEAIAQPDAAVNALMSGNPELKESIVKSQLANSFPLMETEASKRLGLGAFSKAQWERTQDILVENKLLDKKVPNVEVWYTNDFLQ